MLRTSALVSLLSKPVERIDIEPIPGTANRRVHRRSAVHLRINLLRKILSRNVPKEVSQNETVIGAVFPPNLRCLSVSMAGKVRSPAPGLVMRRRREQLTFQPKER